MGYAGYAGYAEYVAPLKPAGRGRLWYVGGYFHLRHSIYRCNLWEGFGRNTYIRLDRRCNGEEIKFDGKHGFNAY